METFTVHSPLHQVILQVYYPLHEGVSFWEYGSQEFWLITQFLLLEEVLNIQSFLTFYKISMFQQTFNNFSLQSFLSE